MSLHAQSSGTAASSSSVAGRNAGEKGTGDTVADESRAEAGSVLVAATGAPPPWPWLLLLLLLLLSASTDPDVACARGSGSSPSRTMGASAVVGEGLGAAWCSAKRMLYRLAVDTAGPGLRACVELAGRGSGELGCFSSLPAADVAALGEGVAGWRPREAGEERRRRGSWKPSGVSSWPAAVRVASWSAPRLSSCDGDTGVVVEAAERVGRGEGEVGDRFSTACLLADDMAHSLMLCVSTRLASRRKSKGTTGQAGQQRGTVHGQGRRATEWLSGTHRGPHSQRK
jgi:hypothetical protein